MGQAARQRCFQESLKFLAADLNCAEAGEMPGDKLRVEQGEASIFEPCDEIDESDLARVADSGEHALAEEGAAEMYAIEAADQSALLPHFDRMAMAERE